jgi:hypothetical protein
MYVGYLAIVIVAYLKLRPRLGRTGTRPETQ